MERPVGLSARSNGALNRGYILDERRINMSRYRTRDPAFETNGRRSHPDSTARSSERHGTLVASTQYALRCE